MIGWHRVCYLTAATAGSFAFFDETGWQWVAWTSALLFVIAGGAFRISKED